MSVPNVSEVIQTRPEQLGLTVTEWVVYVVIIDRASIGGDLTTRALAVHLNLTVKTVRNCLRRLAEVGCAVEVDRRMMEHEGRRHRVPVYAINAPHVTYRTADPDPDQLDFPVQAIA